MHVAGYSQKGVELLESRTIRSESSRRKSAETFLKLTADTADKWDKVEFIQYEAQAYLASRGMFGDADRRAIQRNWDAAVEYEQDEFIKHFPNEELPAPSRILAPKLDYFWDTEIVLSQTVTTPTMLRAASLCEVKGFDAWWERVARESRANALQGGIGFDGIEGSWWSFCMARSDFAIELLGDTLPLIFEQCSRRLGERYPWEERSGPVDNPVTRIHADICAELLFVAERLNAESWDSELRTQAWKALREAFDSSGYWVNQFGPSAIITAEAIHALALGQPPGWKSLVEPAIGWLWSQQNGDGWWDGKTYPGHAFATVLVLDAIDLAEDNLQLTFDIDQGAERLKGTNRESTPFTVDEDLSQIRVDGHSYDVPSKAARMARILLDAGGEWVSMSENGFTKPSDTKCKLPGKIRDMIESSSGKGYRIKPNS